LFLDTENYELVNNPQEMEIYNNTICKLKDLYRFCIEKSPWYSKKLPEFKSDEDFWEAWKNVPQLTKIILRENGEELLTREKDGASLEFVTTGSTGTPTKTVWAGNEYNKCTLEVWNARKRLGAKFSDNIVYFTGLPEEGKDVIEPKITQNGGTIYELTRVFTEKASIEYTDFMKNLEGIVLYGSPSTIYNYANSLKKFDITPPKLNCIELNGEMCEEYEYRTIESTFQAPILNNYGAREMWPIALSCKCGTMHVSNSLVYLENGDDGEILVTSLVKKMQPLLRYNLGDLGKVEWATCKCGKTSQVLTSLIGRKNDYIYRMPGVKEHWALLSKSISNFISENVFVIKEYSVHQKEDYSITVSVVPGVKYSVSEKEKLLLRICAIYPKIRFNIETVNEIPQNHRGKKVYLTCDVKES